MDRVRTVATFIAGVLVGGSAVYFSPPSQGAASGAPQGVNAPLMPPLPEGGSAPPLGSAGGAPPDGMMGMGEPGVQGAGAPGSAPMGSEGMGMGAVPMPNPEFPPPDGANGPPSGEIPAAPAGAVQTSGSRLEKHLLIAPALWAAQAELARASTADAVKVLAADIDTHGQNVPVIGEHMPPMQEVAGYLATSRVLLDRMSGAGMDVADLSLQIDMMMRPPKGKFPGGPKPGSAP